VTDTIREAALTTTGRRLHVEAFAETSQAGLQEIFEGGYVDSSTVPAGSRLRGGWLLESN
jgi:hypothetical protein